METADRTGNEETMNDLSAIYQRLLAIEGRA